LKEFLTIDDLSEHLSIKRSTLYSMVESGELPHYRIGRLIRFKRDDVDQWMEGHRREVSSIEKKTKRILRTVKKPVGSIDEVVKKTIAEVKGNRYTSSHRETRPFKGLGREVSHGTL
jgi:excisionase family DNA binding protein